MGCRITRKKLDNKRFRKTEEAIILAIFKAKEALNLERIIKLARISRSTLYRHHKTVYNIVPDYEQYLMQEYARTIKWLTKAKRVRLSGIYYCILAFIKSYYQIVKLVLEYGDKDIIDKMIILLKPKIISPGFIKNDEMFAIYTKEVASIIGTWVAGGVKKDEIDIAVKKIAYLTDTAAIHLGPITN